MIALLSLFQAQAVVATKTVCVKIPANPTDNSDTLLNPAEDFWVADGNARARGLHVSWTDDAGHHDTHLGANGCADLTLEADSLVILSLHSDAMVNGIHLRSWFEEYLPSGVATHTLLEEPHKVAVTSTPVTLFTKDDVTWFNLAIAQWAFHRNTFGLGTFSSRGCCLSGASADGTCSDPSSAYGEYAATADSTTMDLVYNPGRSCCGSRWTPDPNGGPESGLRPAMTNMTRDRYPASHELGHAVVMKRMGDRTLNAESAPLNDDYLPDAWQVECGGGWKSRHVQDALEGKTVQFYGGLYAMDAWVLPGVVPYLAGPWPKDEDSYVFGRQDWHGSNIHKHPLNMEYQSTAAREGWGEFYSAWLWNRRTQSDCAINAQDMWDFDLDGDLDINYGFEGRGFWDHPWDGFYSCESYGPVYEPFPTTDPLASWLTARDWLGDVTSEGACTVPGSLENRGTSYDWSRFFWDMTTDEQVPPKDLADLYVDMCPTNWAQSDSGTGDRRPNRRLEISATHHGLYAEWWDQRTQGVHR